MTDSSYLRISRLATLTAVHRAFHWLHLHQPQLRRCVHAWQAPNSDRPDSFGHPLARQELCQH